VATDKSLNFALTPIQPIPEGLNLSFLNKLGEEETKAFFEKGQSFQVKASEIQAAALPIFREILKEMGDAKVTIHRSDTLKGCLQFAFQSSREEALCLQIDGEWLIAPKRASFKGRLNQSPLSVELVIEESEAGPQTRFLTFALNWHIWQGQPLLGLAYFNELTEFFRQSNYGMRHYIRGNQPMPQEKLSLDDPKKKEALEALVWLERAKSVARYLGINPPFPRANTINANEMESKEVQLMIKLIESGVHEQPNVGETVTLIGDNPADAMAIGKKELTASWVEQSRQVNFFGVAVPFGPLNHLWTDLELVAANPIGENRVQLSFTGGPHSVWRIEYKQAKD
jgi:hypothetical protein